MSFGAPSISPFLGAEGSPPVAVNHRYLAHNRTKIFSSRPDFQSLLAEISSTNRLKRKQLTIVVLHLSTLGLLVVAVLAFSIAFTLSHLRLLTSLDTLS